MEGEGKGGGVAAKDVGAMYLVLRERVAKMEQHVDDRLNKVDHAARSCGGGSALLRQVVALALCALCG